VATAGMSAAALSASASLASAATPQGSSGGSEAPTLRQAEGARGTVTMCGSEGLAEGMRDARRGFEARYRPQRLRLRVVEFGRSADPHDALVRRLRSGSRRCDFFFTDVIWTAEFAARDWLLDVTGVVRPRRADFIASALSTARYRGRYFGVPQETNVGLLYYRTDRIPTVPDTWQGVYESARQNGGIVYQGAPYEGLTCDFLEVAFAAGGSVTSADGRTSTINSPQNLRALRLMVDGIRSGAALRAVTMYDEFRSWQAFSSGDPAYMRNWPFAYGLGQDPNSPIRDKFGVVPLPAFDQGGPRVGVLGGSNLNIAAYARNPRGAVLAIDYLTSPELIKLNAVRFSSAPVLKATYDDPEVQQALPFAAELRRAVETAKTRPVSPEYPRISRAIYNNVNAALRGSRTPEAALGAAHRQLNQVLRRR
jgi:multiple sugar transport system substrate-binding protein